MERKRLILCIASSTLAVGAFGAVALTTKKGDAPSNVRSADGEYTLVLNSGNVPAALTSSYQAHVNTHVDTVDGNLIPLQFYLAKNAAGAFAQLAPTGLLYNFNPSHEYLGRISGIKSLNVSFTGNLSIRTSTRADGKALSDATKLTSGTTFTLPEHEPFFRLIAGDSGATINSVTIAYTCVTPVAHTVYETAGVYTGEASDIIYKMSIGATGSVNVASLNKASNDSFSGTASIASGNLSIAFSGGTYVASISEDGSVLNYVSNSYSSMPSIGFHRVYEVENFESYDATGNGYDQNHDEFSTSGARGAFYADHYAGSGSSPIGGSGWQLMSGTDYLNFHENGGHNGSKYVSIRGDATGYRYLQKKVFYGTNEIIGRGTTLSFWAKNPYAGSGLTKRYAQDATLKVYAYYSHQVTSATQGQSRTEGTFTIPASTDWFQYTMNLDSSKDYYAIGFYSKDSNATNFLPIDDIEIYTANPHATYVDPTRYPEGTFQATITVKKNWLSSKNVPALITLGKNGQGAVHVNQTSIAVTSVSMNQSTNVVTIGTSGSVSVDNTSYTIGTITATYNASAHTLTSVGANGSIGSKVTNNNSLTFSAPAFHYDAEGDASAMQTTFKRRWNNGSWNVDTSHADRFQPDTRHILAGSQGMNARPYSDGAVGIALNSDVNGNSSIQSTKAMGFWVYNPGESDITLRLFEYTGANLTSAQEFQGSSGVSNYNAKAKQWSYIYGVYPKSLSNSTKLYNFQIYIPATDVRLTFDEISLI